MKQKSQIDYKGKASLKICVLNYITLNNFHCNKSLNNYFCSSFQESVCCVLELQAVKESHPLIRLRINFKENLNEKNSNG